MSEPQSALRPEPERSAYCRTLDLPERMLRRLIGTAGDGVHDRLMEFTCWVTGANFLYRRCGCSARWPIEARAA